MPPSLPDALRRPEGMTVGDYIAWSNGVYYGVRDPFGVAGDFITAPEISQVFGELLAAWLAERWQALGAPEAMLVEPGPGRGTLMRDMLRVLARAPNARARLRVHLIETSPLLRARQQATLAPFADWPITWAETLETLPPLPLLLVANEFFDALPVEQYVATPGGETLRRVRLTQDDLAFFPEGEVMREVSPVSITLATLIARHIATYQGAALLIDYGYAAPPGHSTLQALCRHQHVPPLAWPGASDLTAHVDFTALANAARSAGAYAHPLTPQGIFLRRLGVEMRTLALCRTADAATCHTLLSGMARLVAPDQMGELFKVLAVTSSADIPAGCCPA